LEIISARKYGGMRARRRSGAGGTVGKKDGDDEVCKYSLKGRDELLFDKREQPEC
jgi:hypothetical protein